MIPIGANTRIAGVVGAPIAQSLSPLLHNAWLAAAEIDAVYLAFPVQLTRLALFVDGLRGGAVLGLNVTAPFKIEALALATEGSATAVEAGSANLLLFPADGRVLADSTDGLGLLTAFAAQAPGHDMSAGAAVVLGAGGAARAAAAAIARAGAPEIRLLARSSGRAEQAAATLGGEVVGGAITEGGRLAGGATTLVNTTPSGALGDELASRLVFSLSPSAVVMDMVYRPPATPLLRAARTRGLGTVDGLAMLIGQAEPSFAALFGMPPPPLNVRNLATEAIGAELGR